MIVLKKSTLGSPIKISDLHNHKFYIYKVLFKIKKKTREQNIKAKFSDNLASVSSNIRTYIKEFVKKYLMKKSAKANWFFYLSYMYSMLIIDGVFKVQLYNQFKSGWYNILKTTADSNSTENEIQKYKNWKNIAGKTLII